MSFVGLHIHSDYSLLDGASQIPALIDRCLELDMSAIALTDHGVMYGAIELIKVCKSKGIKPIIGNEMYIINGDIEYNPKEKKKRHRKFHQVVLAKNTQGYKNLVKLTTISHLKGYQGSGIFARPCINKELLEKYHDGLIVTSACLGGEVPQRILSNDLEEARKVAKWYKNVFGDDYYLEIQDHGSQEDRIVNTELVKIARELGIKIVATNDSHFISCYDVEAHDALLCILTQKRITDDKRLRYSGTEYLKSAKEMKLLFRDHLPDDVIEEAINNTVEVADKVQPYNILGKPRIPDYPIPAGHTADSYLEEISWQGLLERLKCPHISELDPIYVERLKIELKVMQEKGFATYFLVVWDYIKYARDNDIPVGPGRGCVLGDTKVMLSSGKEIDIKDIEVGQEIITHQGNLKNITHKHEYDCDEEIVKLKISNLELSLTQDHKIWAIKTEECVVQGAKKATVCKPTCTRYCKPKPWQNYSLEWIEADKLNPNDFVVFPRVASTESEILFDVLDFINKKDYLYFDNEFIWYEISTNHLATKKIPRYILFNEDFARLLGYYIAEGWSRLGERECAVGFGLSKAETNYANEISSLIDRIFGLEASIIPHKTSYSQQVICYSRIVGEFLTALSGKGANNKHIYDKIITHGKSELIKILIAYLFRGDGHAGNREKTTTIKYTTTSKVLASQLRLLLARFGYWASVIIRKHKQNTNWHPEFSVKLAGRQLLDWNTDFMDFPIGIKAQKFFRNDSFFVDENYIYLKIRAVKKVKYTGKVYDITVPEDTSYVGNAIAIHNSAAGSLVAYSLKITNIDPIHHGLLFERFLNPERMSMPDVDTDFCPDRRGDMIQYVTDKYGESNVAQIITFNRMTSKAVLKDVGRVLGIDFGDQNRIAKMIPVVRGKPTKLKVMISDDTPEPDFKKAYDTERVKVYNDKKEEVGSIKISNWVDMAIRIEGTNKTFGVHAAGVVISSQPLDEIVPLQKNNDGSVITQYYMADLEDLGLLKMDFLGLKNLTTIQRAVDLIRQTKNVELDLDQIPLDEHKALEILSKGKIKKLPGDIQTTHNLFKRGDLGGIFQLESDGMKQITRDLKPSGIEDLSSISALYRPGPLDAGLIPLFIERKHGREKVAYDHPLLEPILKETYGVMVYQEQIMKIAQELAGYSLGEADLLRRCLSGSTKVIDADKGKAITLREIAANPQQCLNKQVFCLDLKTQKITTQVIEAIYSNGIKDVWEITTKTNRKIKATKDHLFYTLLGWQKLEEFQKGDRIGLAKNLPINHTSNVSKAKIKLVAYLIGDGHLSTKSPANSYFCNSNPQLIEDFNQCCYDLFDSYAPIDCQTHPHRKTVSYVRIGFLSKFNQWVDSNLKRAHSRDKEIPQWVFNLSRHHLQLFLGTLWSTDGSFDNKTGHTAYNSTSKVLVEQIQHLLLRLGIVALFNVKKITYKNKPYISYRAQVTGREEVIKFCELIKPYLSNAKYQQATVCYQVVEGKIKTNSKHTIPQDVIHLIRDAKYSSGMTWQEIDTAVGLARETMSSGLNFKQPNRSLARHRVQNFAIAFENQELDNIANSEVFWDEIINIEYVGKEEVFDLTIPEHHNFIANDFIAHNCMGKKKIDEMKKHREKFIDGSAKNGVIKEVADKLFDEMVLFAEYCLSYDTEILTVEYGAVAIGKIVENKLDCHVYSVDKNGFIYTQPIAQWHNRGEQEIFEYTLENGATIKATKDHKFMTSDGTMLQIDRVFELGRDLLELAESKSYIVNKYNFFNTSR